jgi:hypothetical protein
MKHIKTVAKSRPMVAGGEEIIFCQIAVALTALGVPIPKELLTKCLGVDL